MTESLKMSSCFNLWFHWNNSEKVFFFVTIVSAKHVDGFVRGETLNIFLGILNESKLHHLFEEEIDNIRRQVIKPVDM